jgi:hypothetical protein
LASPLLDDLAMTRPLHQKKTHQLTQWAKLIPEDECSLYRVVIDEACARGIDFAVGGAFAVATYTGYWRNTKDLDLYVRPAEKDKLLDVLADAGLKDYFDEKPYDRWWIYRGTKNGTILDVIWAMANHRQQIDELWMSGPKVDLLGHQLKVLPAEALVWDKLYIMQRERCDWPDVLNLLYHVATDLDWEYLLARMGEDRPLMAGLMSVFRWMSPGLAQSVPRWVWNQLDLGPPPSVPLPAVDSRRVSLLDRRPWFGADREKLQPAA